MAADPTVRRPTHPAQPAAGVLPLSPVPRVGVVEVTPEDSWAGTLRNAAEVLCLLVIGALAVLAAGHTRTRR